MTIGDGAVIAGGSVVTENVKPRTLVAGNLAKKKKTIKLIPISFMEENKIDKVGDFIPQSLMQDLRQIINQARGRVAAKANYELTMMYWNIGERINREVLGNQRAEYGKQIVATLSRQLQEDYGKKGFDVKSIRRMMQFAHEFPEEQIVSAVSTQLTWSHIIEILPLKNILQREFYLTLAVSERWSVRQLRKEIDGMLYERTAIASKPDELI